MAAQAAVQGIVSGLLLFPAIGIVGAIAAVSLVISVLIVASVI